MKFINYNLFLEHLILKNKNKFKIEFEFFYVYKIIYK